DLLRVLPEVAGRNPHEFRHAAGVEVRGTPDRAVDVSPAAAGGAFEARRVVVRHDAVPFAESANVFSDLGDLPRALVPGPGPGLRLHVPVEQVRAADSRGPRAHPHFARPDLVNRDVDQLDTASGAESDRLHRGPPPRALSATISEVI